MLFAPSTHAVLLAVGLVGILVLGAAFRREQLWPAVLLWVVPVVLTLSATDGLLRLLTEVWPVAAMDGGPGDRWRFAVAFLLVLPPIEVVYQGAVTILSDRGVHHYPAGGAPDRR